MTPPVVLYGLSRSVYTRIARLVLEEKGVAYVLQGVEIFGTAGVPAEHFARHPFGRIPVLAHGDLQFYETAAICRYVDEAFPGPDLQPSNPAARARMAQIIGLLDAYAYRPMVWGVFVQRVSLPLRGGITDEGVVASSLKQVATSLDALASLQGAGPYLVAGSLTLADLHAYPMLKYLSVTPEGTAALATRPQLNDWLSRMDQRPSVQRTRSQYEQASAA
jgi:glutathione S-transferase